MSVFWRQTTGFGKAVKKKKKGMWDFREQGSEMHDQDQPPPRPLLEEHGQRDQFF